LPLLGWSSGDVFSWCRMLRPGNCSHFVSIGNLFCFCVTLVSPSSPTSRTPSFCAKKQQRKHPGNQGGLGLVGRDDWALLLNDACPVEASLTTRAFLAALTEFCQIYSLAGSLQFPLSMSIKSSSQWVQRFLPLRLSRTIISCKPSQFVPSPSPLSDQILSRPVTELCSRR